MLVARLTDAQNGNNNLVSMLEAAEAEKKKFSNRLQEFRCKLQDNQCMIDEERATKEALSLEV